MTCVIGSAGPRSYPDLESISGGPVPSPEECRMNRPRSKFVAWGFAVALGYVAIVISVSMAGCTSGSGNTDAVTALAAHEMTSSGSEEAVLADAPNVPPPIHRDHATKVVVKLEVREVVKRLADGVDYTFWT